MIENLQDLFIFENYVTMDKVRKLKWCNNTMRYALDYLRIIFNKHIDYDGLLKKLKDSDVIISLLYGAARAADETVDIMKFSKMFKAQYTAEYLLAIAEGVRNYLPEPDSTDHGQGLDEDWPDTQAELRKKGIYEKTDWASWYWFVIKLGINPSEFWEMSLRNIYVLYKRYLKDHGIDMYAEDDRSWL